MSKPPIHLNATFESLKDLEAAVAKVKETVVWVRTSSHSIHGHNKKQTRPSRIFPEVLEIKDCIYLCKSGKQRESESTGLRPNQRSVKINCPARFNVNAENVPGKGKVLRITQGTWEHNHEVSKEFAQWYSENRRPDESQLKVVELMTAARGRPLDIRDHLHSLGKAITTKDLSNLQAKIRKGERKGDTELLDVIGEMKLLKETDPGAVFSIGYNEDGTIDFLYFHTSAMSEVFKKFPEVLGLDTTYKTNKNDMHLSVLQCIDNHGNGRVVGYCFMRKETMDIIQTSLEQFKEANKEFCDKIRTVVVDKDYKEIQSIKTVLPGAHVHICHTHVLRIFDRTTQGEQNRVQVKKLLRDMSQSASKKIKDELYVKLKAEASKEFMEYFDTYWKDIDEAWILYVRDESLSLGVRSNNYVESHNQKIKSVTDRYKCLGDCIRGLLRLHRNREFESSFKNFKEIGTRAYVANCDDEDVKEIMDNFAQWPAKLLYREWQHSFDDPDDDPENEIVTTVDSCNCGFIKKFGIEHCRHLFYARRGDGVPRLRINKVPERYLKKAISIHNEGGTGVQSEDRQDNANSINVFPNRKTPLGPKPVDQCTRYNAALRLTAEICNLVSVTGNTQFEGRIAVLQNIILHWQAGREVAVVPVLADGLIDIASHSDQVNMETSETKNDEEAEEDGTLTSNSPHKKEQGSSAKTASKNDEETHEPSDTGEPPSSRNCHMCATFGPPSEDGGHKCAVCRKPVHNFGCATELPGAEDGYGKCNRICWECYDKDKAKGSPPGYTRQQIVDYSQHEDSVSQCSTSKSSSQELIYSEEEYGSSHYCFTNEPTTQQQQFDSSDQEDGSQLCSGKDHLSPQIEPGDNPLSQLSLDDVIERMKNPDYIKAFNKDLTSGRLENSRYISGKVNNLDENTDEFSSADEVSSSADAVNKADEVNRAENQQSDGLLSIIPDYGRYQRGIEIADKDVECCGPGKWKIKSQDKDCKKKFYIVTQKSIFCAKDVCKPFAPPCRHRFVCSCQDLTNPCKHIIKVHSICFPQEKTSQQAPVVQNVPETAGPTKVIKVSLDNLHSLSDILKLPPSQKVLGRPRPKMVQKKTKKQNQKYTAEPEDDHSSDLDGDVEPGFTLPWERDDFPSTNWKLLKSSSSYICSGFTLSVDDIKSLKPGEFLNDSIIDVFSSLMISENEAKNHSDNLYAEIDNMPSSALLNTEIGMECYITDIVKSKIVLNDLVIVPSNINLCHWVLFLVLTKLKKIVILDPLYRKKSLDPKVEEHLQILRYALAGSYHHCFDGLALDWDEWNIYAPIDFPRQDNGLDCGVYVCMWIFSVCLGETLNTANFSQLKQIRHYICHKILSESQERPVRPPLKSDPKPSKGQPNLDVSNKLYRNAFQSIKEGTMTVNRLWDKDDLRVPQVLYSSPVAGKSTLEVIGTYVLELSKATDEACGAPKCKLKGIEGEHQMFVCEICREWYHLKCVGDARSPPPDEVPYLCPLHKQGSTRTRVGVKKPLRLRKSLG